MLGSTTGTWVEYQGGHQLERLCFALRSASQGRLWYLRSELFGGQAFILKSIQPMVLW